MNLELAAMVRDVHGHTGGDGAGAGAQGALEPPGYVRGLDLGGREVGPGDR